MSASATLVSFLLIESCRLQGTASKRHNTINYRSFKHFNPDHFCSELQRLVLLLKTGMSETILKTQMTCLRVARIVFLKL